MLGPHRIVIGHGTSSFTAWQIFEDGAMKAPQEQYRVRGMSVTGKLLGMACFFTRRHGCLYSLTCLHSARAWLKRGESWDS